MPLPRYAAPPTLLCLSVSLLSLVVSLRAQAPSPPSGQASRKGPHKATALFVHSENCVSCHNRLATGRGEDVSIGSAWQSTIMANAARDPYFHASVRRETIDHPAQSA